jgi:hypothetical protein
VIFELFDRVELFPAVAAGDQVDVIHRGQSPPALNR